MKTRADLDADLYQLRVALPLWRRSFESDEAFREHCAGLASRVFASAAPNDRDYAARQLHDVLDRHGMTAPLP